jgi:hypothetical protein
MPQNLKSTKLHKKVFELVANAIEIVNPAQEAQVLSH